MTRQRVIYIDESDDETQVITRPLSHDRSASQNEEGMFGAPNLPPEDLAEIEDASNLTLLYNALDKYSWKGNVLVNGRIVEHILRRGKCVELKDKTFLQIKQVIRCLRTKEVKIQGLQLHRNSTIGGLSNKRNEVSFVLQVELDDQRSSVEQSVIEVSLDKIDKVRKIIFTNAPYPEHSYTYDYAPSGSDRMRQIWVTEHEVLVARWSVTTTFNDAARRRTHNKKPNNFVPVKILRLDSSECTASHYVSASRLRDISMGSWILGGSHRREQGTWASPILLDSEDGNSSGSSRYSDPNIAWEPASRQYTYGDAFCGAGGATRGAEMAGAHVKWGLDLWSEAGKTWRANFPGASFFQEKAQEFVERPDNGQYKVDILHISPPCQPYSPMHPAAEGQNDDENVSGLFTVGALASIANPRIITIEETFGILFPRYRHIFNNLINMLTDLGYSVSWQLVDMPQYGLPSLRKRLFLIAAAPGETLPKFPAPTHSATGGRGLKRFAPAASAINSIPRNARNHAIKPGSGSRLQPWDSSVPSTCVTGGGVLTRGHPSGSRDLTHRELASLIGFPLEHEFIGTGIKLQIGNSVPPLVYEVFMKSIIEHLRETDRGEFERRRNGPAL